MPTPAPDRLLQLRCNLAQPLSQPDSHTLRNWTAQVSHWSVQHFTSLPEQPLGPSPTRSEMELLLREPLLEAGKDLPQVLDQFTADIATNLMQVGHPRFLAFVPSAPSFLSVLGDWLTSALNCFAGVWFEAASAAMIELVVLDWFKEWLGYPTGARGLLTSGGSEATLTALVVARETLNTADRQRAVLYESDQRHWSVDRAARIIGFRPEQLRVLPTDTAFRLALPALHDAIREDRRAGLRPWVVVANAGATNTGAVDPLPELADLCQEHRLWLHADAAYGWSAVLDSRGREQLRGLERADSITLDPHKWLAQTFDAGCLLVRDGPRLAEPFRMRPEYLQDVLPHEEECNFADHGLALTRRFRALKIWFSLQVLGLGWFRALIGRCLDLAELLELLLVQAGFEILAPRSLSVLCFRYVPPGFNHPDLDALNLALARALRATGRAFLSTTRLRGRVALRCCFINWRTTAADVEEVVEMLSGLGARLARGEQVG